MRYFRIFQDVNFAVCDKFAIFSSVTKAISGAGFTGVIKCVCDKIASKEEETLPVLYDPELNEHMYSL